MKLRHAIVGATIAATMVGVYAQGGATIELAQGGITREYQGGARDYQGDRVPQDVDTTRTEKTASKINQGGKLPEEKDKKPTEKERMQ